ncbi:MAG: hypothetical protein KDI90_10695 [Alphaproteobacteria bacterium]|nr:hypothetical protein [Alphaproteobacteria bacterium]MCB9974119.1 hypothetical protein [Rhodospirillales bacterium]
MLFLLTYIAANLYMAVISWQVYRRLQKKRGRPLAWTFQNAVNFFLIWTLVTGLFEVAFFHSYALNTFLGHSAQLLIFLGLIKIGTMEYHFSCGKACRAQTAPHP